MASKKLKKFLKKAGKAALIGGALYGATKLGKRGIASTNPIGGVDALVRAKLKRNKLIDAGIAAAEADKGSEMYIPPKVWNQDQRGVDPAPYLFKKGGRVTGIAKRGFGRALMKGKK